MLATNIKNEMNLFFFLIGLIFPEISDECASSNFNTNSVSFSFIYVPQHLGQNNIFCLFVWTLLNQVKNAHKLAFAADIEIIIKTVLKYRMQNRYARVLWYCSPHNSRRAHANVLYWYFSSIPNCLFFPQFHELYAGILLPVKGRRENKNIYLVEMRRRRKIINDKFCQVFSVEAEEFRILHSHPHRHLPMVCASICLSLLMRVGAVHT